MTNLRKSLSSIFMVTVICLLSVCCGDNGTDDNDDDGTPENTQYRNEMREFVQEISTYCKAQNPSFQIIPQNGHDLLTVNGSRDGNPATAYIAAIDAVGREDLNYGYDDDNKPTADSDRAEMAAFMDIAEKNDVEALVTDYCWTRSYIDQSYQRNNSASYISFAANSRELDTIPDYPAAPYGENADNIVTLSDAKNFLYLLNTDSFDSKNDFIETLGKTNYDVFIIDLFFDGSEALSKSDLAELAKKANGGSRLVIAYMSIGEAEDYRYYWQESWKKSPPSWLAGENPYWQGNYKVRYWDENWKDIIFGSGTSYVDKIIDAGFDGVYLDIIDAFEYFEDQN